MTPSNYQWVNPYKLKVNQEARVSFFGRFIPGSYEVYFEDTLLMTFNGVMEQAGKLVAMLNGAYNLGRSSAMIEAEVQKESQSEDRTN